MTTLLIVNDDAGVRGDTARFLAAHGFETIEAHDVAEASVFLGADEVIDLVLLDETSAAEPLADREEASRDRIRILIVDDHEIFAHSLVRLLGSHAEFEVVGTAGKVSEAVAAASASMPDVVLMDFALPDGNGPEATARIRSLVPSAKVVMLTARTDESALVDAIAAGCAGFVKKEDGVDVLFATIVAAHEGETLAPIAELAPLLRRLGPTQRGLGADLTTRQLEVLSLIASGMVNKEIAHRLGLTLNTVRNHAQNILHKLGAHSRLEAVATAVREGLITY